MSQPGDQPSACEIAVTEDGHVVINFHCAACHTWGHLSFDPQQAADLIDTVRQALAHALQLRVAPSQRN